VRKLVVAIALPITLEIDVRDNASDGELLVKILEHAGRIDPREHEGFIIQEVLDSKQNNANIIMRILEVQDQIEEEELEEKRRNNYYYLNNKDSVDNLF